MRAVRNLSDGTLGVSILRIKVQVNGRRVVVGDWWYAQLSSHVLGVKVEH